MIGTGMWMALIMAFNVWFIIWPNQQKILGLVEATAEQKAAAAKPALYASRFNTMFSIGMLYCMVAQQNMPVPAGLTGAIDIDANGALRGPVFHVAARHREAEARADQQPAGDAIAQPRMRDQQPAQPAGEHRPDAVAHDRHREERHGEQQELPAALGPGVMNCGKKAP